MRFGIPRALCVTLALSTAAASASDLSDAQKQFWNDNYIKLEGEIRSSASTIDSLIASAHEMVPELGKYNQKALEVNRGFEKARKTKRGDARYQDKIDDLFKTSKALEERFPGLGTYSYWLREKKKANKDDFDLYLASETAIVKVMEKFRNELASQLRPGCFDKANYSYSSSCATNFASQCERFGLRDAQVYIREVSDVAEVRNVEITSGENFATFLSDKFKSEPSFMDSYAVDQFNKCKMISLSGFVKTPDYIYWPKQWVDSTPKWMMPLSDDFLASGINGVRNGCLSVDHLSDAVKMMHSEGFEKTDSVATAVNQNINLRLRLCKVAVGRGCSNVAEVRGSPYLSYLTARCEVRNVTAADIRSDVERFKSSEVTEADQLAHLAMVDLIEFCTDAKAAGYSWMFLEPDKKTCKREKKK